MAVDSSLQNKMQFSVITWTPSAYSKLDYATFYIMRYTIKMNRILKMNHTYPTKM